MPDVPAANASLTPQPGTLYVVATPIGNLADFTDRARAILGAVDLVACEDTRTTGGLLTRMGLRRELISYHDHNETAAADHIAAQIAAGKSVALVSDAGTPAISDPGFRLVRACRRQGLPVIPVPGACALRGRGRLERQRPTHQRFSFRRFSDRENFRAHRLPPEISRL